MQMSEAARRLQRGASLVSYGFLEERRSYFSKEARVIHEQGPCFQDVRNIINILIAATEAGFGARENWQVGHGREMGALKVESWKAVCLLTRMAQRLSE